MKDYYSECLEQIQKLIAENELEKAHECIMEELRMPYVPSDFEEKLKILEKETRASSIHVSLSEEEMIKYLFLDETKQLLAIKELSERNVRKYIDLIQDTFDHASSLLVTLSLMEVCIEQQLNEEFRIEKDGLEIYFIPSACTLPLDSEGLEECLAILKEWLESEDPSYYDLCCQCAVKEAYLHMPLEIDESESEEMAGAIVRYVSSLLGVENEMEELLSKKSTSQKDGFELLLYSNII